MVVLLECGHLRHLTRHLVHLQSLAGSQQAQNIVIILEILEGLETKFLGSLGNQATF